MRRPRRQLRALLILGALTLGLLTAVLGSEPAPGAGPAEAGRVHLFREGERTFERWVHRADCGRFLNRYHRMRLYPPHADACVKHEYRGGLAYVDAQAIYPREVRPARGDSRRERRSKRRLARLILRDRRGRPLYVPYACDGTSCPQYAAAIGRSAFRAHVLKRVQGAIRSGFRGIFLDDVNWNLNVSDGAGTPAEPINPATGRPLELDAWRARMADLVEAVRDAAPGAEIMINSVWWKPESTLDDPQVARGVGAATHYELERGTEDVFRGQSWDGLLGTIDRLHTLGLGVNLDNFAAGDRRGAEFEMATYFLISEGEDSFAAGYASCPSSDPPSPCREPFWSGYRTDLGAPEGPRANTDEGLVSRRFERGLVLVNPPGGPQRTHMLDSVYFDLDGGPRVSVTLGGGEAAVLKRP